MTQANDIVVVSGVRTAIGTFNGSLKHTHQHDLGAAVIREAVNRAGLAPQDIDETIVGNVGKSPKAALSPASASYGRGSRRRTLPIRLTASAAPDFRPWRTA